MSISELHIKNDTVRNTFFISLLYLNYFYQIYLCSVYQNFFIFFSEFFIAVSYSINKYTTIYNFNVDKQLDYCYFIMNNTAINTHVLTFCKI